MVNVDLKNGVIQLDDDYITIITEVLIVITKILFDNPDSIEYLIGVINSIDLSIKVGLDLDAILDKLITIYNKRNDGE